MMLLGIRVAFRQLHGGARAFTSLIKRDGVTEYIEKPIIYPTMNYLTNQAVVYPTYVHSKRKSFLKLAVKETSKINDTEVEEYLKKQQVEDEVLIKPPKEVIFIGRSNVGKSSLMNALVNEKLCVASKTPGRTSKLQFVHLANNRGALVDTPGYGWTKASVKTKKPWVKMLNQYLKQSKRVCRIFFLINMEHGVKVKDFEYLELVSRYQHSIQPVLTKCDKVKDADFLPKITAITQQLRQFDNMSPVIHVVSTKDKFGIDNLRDAVIASFLDFSSREELERLKTQPKVRVTTIKDDKQLSETNSNSSIINIPPPEEMFKLIYTTKNS